MTGQDGGILIADGHPLCRSGLVSMVAHDLGVPRVSGVADFPAVLQALTSDSSIVLLAIDSHLPGLNGLEDLKRIRHHWPSLRVVVTTWHHHTGDALSALSAGVHGYIPKDMPAADLASAFSTVLSGHIYVPEMISEGAWKTTPPDGGGHPAPHAVLTVRQREVLTLLADGKSNKEIGRALNISEGTVKVHITASFRILGVHNRVGAAAALQKLVEPTPAGQPELPGLGARKPDAGPIEKMIFVSISAFVGQSWLEELPAALLLL
jgi:DNA-binding NarL/FixJ family response regulator